MKNKVVTVLILCLCLMLCFLINTAIEKIPFLNDDQSKQISISAAVILVLLAICCIARMTRRRYSLKKLDKMNGHEFEYACAEILKANKFKHIKVTKSTGDFGVDIIAEKYRERYAIQCKCYSRALGNKPIQEVIGGLAYYDCTIGAVMTNQYFTKGAQRLAEINGIELWDRDVLSQMIRRSIKSVDLSEYDDSDAEDEENGQTEDI